MSSLTPLGTCLAQALHGLAPVPVEPVPLAAACGHVLAADVRLERDLPPVAEALRAGHAVAALDLVGAGAGAPVPLGMPVRVLPGDCLPPGTDAVLPPDGIDATGGLAEAIRPVAPGEGVRRAGHDGRTGDLVLPAGLRIGPRARFLAALAGLEALPMRRPRVRVALDDPRHAAFAEGFLRALGGVPAREGAELTLCSVSDPAPRLALTPAETAWLEREAGGLVLRLPARFDGVVAGCLALALPAMAGLGGAVLQARTRPLARKVTSTVGVSELVLLGRDGDGWQPQPAGMVTLTGLAAARAFAILPPDSEGLPAGAALAAHPLDRPFG